MFSQEKTLSGLDDDLDDFFEIIQKSSEKELSNLLFNPVGERDFFLHQVMRYGNSKICLLLLKKVSSDYLSQIDLLKPDFDGKNALQIAIFREDPLSPKVLFYFIKKLSFKIIADALKSNFEDATDYLPKKTNCAVLQAVVDCCLLELNSSSNQYWHQLTKYQKIAKSFLGKIDLWNDCFSQQWRESRKLFFSLTPEAVNHNPEAFLSFFEAIIPDDFNKFGSEKDAQWLAHIELALKVVKDKEQYGDRLRALKIRLLYFSFQLPKFQEYLLEKFIQVDLNSIIALILEIRSFEYIDSADCAMMAELLSTNASMQSEEKSDNFLQNTIFLRKRLQCLYAAVQQGRIEWVPFLHALLSNIIDVEIKKVNANQEKWGETDEQRFQLIMATENVLNQRKDQLKAAVSLKLSSISSTDLFERKITIEENAFQEKESLEDEARYNEARKQGKQKICHWKYHSKGLRKWEEWGLHQHASFDGSRDLSCFPVKIFPFDFEDFKKKNADLAESTKRDLSLADSLEILDEQFKKYCTEFEKLESKFLLKIKNVRNLKKIVYYQEKLFSPNAVKTANQEGDASEEVKEDHFIADCPLAALQRELSDPHSPESLDQAIKEHKDFQDKTTYQFLLKRGIWASLEAEIIRLKNKNGTASEEEKRILDNRIGEIENFLKHQLQEKNESTIKKSLFDLSEKMTAATGFRRWANYYLPCFFKSQSQGGSIIYHLANQLRSEAEVNETVHSHLSSSSI